MSTTREERVNKRVNKRVEKVVKNLLEARRLIIGASILLDEVYDSIVGELEIINLIDKNLAYFPEDVKKVDEDFYNRFLVNKD